MKTFREFMNESATMNAFIKPGNLGNKYSLKFKIGPGKAAATVGNNIGDWRKFTNAMDANNVKRMKITNDTPKKFSAMLLKIFDKVESKGYELDIIDKHNPDI